MPKRARSSTSGSSKRRRTNVRSMRKHRVRRVPRTRISASLGLPDKAMVKHKYVELFATANLANLPWVWRFSCNSMFDPNTTGVGHQPLYRDEFAALYNHYRVISSKVKVRIQRLNSATDNLPAVILVDIDDDAATNIDIRTQMEEGRNVKFIAGDMRPTVITKSWNAKKHFPSGTMQNLSAAVGSNPAEQSYYNIMVQPTDLASIVSFHATVEIEYYVQWFEKKTPTPS